jgi:hypothetical protein
LSPPLNRSAASSPLIRKAESAPQELRLRELKKRTKIIKLSQNFSFGKAVLDKEGKTGLFAVFFKTVPKTKRRLGKAFPFEILVPGRDTDRRS